MSVSRLRERVPSAIPLGCYTLKGHDLRFHTSGGDESAKCDAYDTANDDDRIYGVLFEMDATDKPTLDRAEGLGYGYQEKEITVIAADGSKQCATTYVAIRIDESLKPYFWYVNHVLVGANETHLPEGYIRSKIRSVEAVEDDDKERDARERAVHG